ncbi:MAG: dephospho-CoA kinase, partial [Cytophagales bacterium]|nr:dephospho-CoA kinase [Cytophagales bacterium]
MPNALKVGLTGGIGSGKSLVAKTFTILGVPCYDSDSRARWVTENSPRVKQQIIDLFGTNAYSPNG